MADLKPRYPDNEWDQANEYLKGKWILNHNDDYFLFLVEKVWKLDSPCSIVDFGCGNGMLGSILMPLLPEGSSYSGFDQSATLIEEAKRMWKSAPYQSSFNVGTIFDAPFEDSLFDVSISNAVLMHVPHPEKAIEQMIRVTKDGGMVITCDANRNAHNALFHIHETRESENAALELFQTMNREIFRQTGVDHNLGVKTPVLMHKAGLKNVQARMNDSMRLLFPPFDTDYKKSLFEAMCREGFGIKKPNDEQRAKWKANIVGYGVPEDEADRQIDREIERDFLHRAEEFHTVYAHLTSFSFGTVDKSAGA